MLALREPPPLALYIHFPWCVRKCPYCDFNSHELRDSVPEQAYIHALLQDLEQELPRIWGRQVISVFMGGGTPSLFSPEAMDTLIAGLRARLNLKPDIEITLEANPGTLERDKFSEFRSAGITRLSIGVQSFQDDNLVRLGRIHNGRDAIRAAEAAHKAGLENFNLDLMYGLPDQTVQSALPDLATAVDLCPAHLSYYQLTIEPNTLFHHQPPSLPDEDRIFAIEDSGRQYLAKSGFARYEISAYAKPGSQCTHNLNYWQFGDYLGIGAGAHSKISDVQQQQIQRSWKVKNPRDYLSLAAGPERIGGSQTLSETALPFEFMLNALRLTEGVDSTLYSQRTGLDIYDIQTKLQLARERELLVPETDKIKPSTHGLNFLNDLTALFLDEETHAE